MIKTIIFDLAEVYLRGLSGLEVKLEPILKVDRKKIVSDWHVDGKLFDLFVGKISEDEFWLYIIEKGGWNVDINTIKKALRENFEEIEGTRKIIVALRRKGFKLGLLSAHVREWIEFCNKKYKYHELFDRVSYSFDTGVSKPDKRAYEIILSDLNSKPAECLFIDDRKENLAPAKELGMKTILFTTSSDLKRELLNIGIEL